MQTTVWPCLYTTSHILHRRKALHLCRTRGSPRGAKRSSLACDAHLLFQRSTHLSRDRPSVMSPFSTGAWSSATVVSSWDTNPSSMLRAPVDIRRGNEEARAMEFSFQGPETCILKSHLISLSPYRLISHFLHHPQLIPTSHSSFTSLQCSQTVSSFSPGSRPSRPNINTVILLSLAIPPVLRQIQAEHDLLALCSLLSHTRPLSSHLRLPCPYLVSRRFSFHGLRHHLIHTYPCGSLVGLLRLSFMASYIVSLLLPS
ncbi:hypothetical protein BC826DRAFT_145617 [Russula brevipes]|nr:hypothetical protein BC826DRAFT_145617 [Russula brevipes]